MLAVGCVDVAEAGVEAEGKDTPRLPSAAAGDESPAAPPGNERWFVELCLEDRLHALEILDLLFKGIGELGKSNTDEDDGGLSSADEADAEPADEPAQYADGFVPLDTIKVKSPVKTKKKTKDASMSSEGACVFVCV